MNQPAYDTRQRIAIWRRCMGLCCICGQMMASPQFALPIEAQVTQDNNATAEADDDNNSISAIDTDGRLLTEESPVRLAFLRYNALADMQFAHIIDDYTFLEGKRNTPKDFSVFKDELRTHFARIRPASPEALDALYSQIMTTPNANRLYERAVSTQKRVVDNLTVPSCRRCNKAMDRIYSHVLATYRCFPLTRTSEVPQLEGRDATTIMAGRLLQQIALYFQPPPSHKKKMEWEPKTDHDLLCDANLWRCIAHLWNWGQSPIGGGVRFRMIALFHASHFVYLNSRLRGSMPFETWHVHVWRPYLMDTYPRANTFLGTEQQEAARLFDLVTTKNGAQWDSELRARLMRIVDTLDEMQSQQQQLVERALRLEQALTQANVVDETSLILNLRQRYEGNAQRALHVLLEFFQYNLSDGSASAFLLRRCRLLCEELERAATRLAYQEQQQKKVLRKR
jgi:hypothetical protein